MQNTQMTLTKKILKNTIYNFLGRLWAAIVGILLTPYIVSKLGIERFGVWAIIFAVTGYFSLLDFGVGQSFVRFIANAWGKNDREKINKIISTGFFFYFIFAIILVIIAFILGKPIIKLVKIPATIQDEAFFVLIGAITIFGFSNSLGIFRSAIDGLQKMDITNKISMIISIPNISGTVIVLELGYGLKGLIVNNGIIVLLSAAISFFFARKLLMNLKISIFQFSSGTFKELFNYGIKLQASNLSGLVNLQTDKILLAYFLNLSIVTFYELGYRVTMTVRSLPTLLFSAVVPAASELQAKSDDSKIYKLYTIGSKYLAAVTIPLAFFLLVTSEVIMDVWMGSGYKSSAMVIRILTVGYFINLLTGVATSTAKGMGKVEYEMRSSILVPILNIILSIILITKFGLVGALIATAFSVTVGSIYYMQMFHKYIIKTLFSHFVKEMYLKPALFSLVVGVLVYFLNFVIQKNFILFGRMDYFILLGLDFLIFFSFYLFFIVKSNYFEKEDIETAFGSIDLRKIFSWEN